MNDAFDFGRYAPYIWFAYGVSVLGLGALIYARRRKLRRALEADEADNNNNKN